MTKDEAMKMALDALDTLPAGTSYKTHNAASALRQALEQPSDIEAAVRAENEACAKVCESLRDEDGYEAWGVQCAEAIRERMK